MLNRLEEKQGTQGNKARSCLESNCFHANEHGGKIRSQEDVALQALIKTECEETVAGYS